MKTTRVKILADLEAWARDSSSPKVYWLNGLLGTGKTSISHTFSERLDAHQILGASFFCSRSTSKDATCIIPTIANRLAASNPTIRSAILEVLTNKRDVVDFSSLPLAEQFSSLITEPIKLATEIKGCIVIVIDAIDECSSPWMVETLIRTILDCVTNLPLKFFITSRPEDWIKTIFRREAANRPKEFSLHAVAKRDVQGDILTFLSTSLSEIADRHGYSQHGSHWPPQNEVTSLVTQSDGLFIYAATALRYIGAPRVNSQRRLTEFAASGSKSVRQASTIDSLYCMIMDQAFDDNLEDNERALRREILATVLFLQTPLSQDGIAALLETSYVQIEVDLSPFHSVIDIPSTRDGCVSIFHSSFHEFITNPARCGDRHYIDPSETQQKLLTKTLECLNKSLRRNICNLPEDTIGDLPHEITDSSVISEPLRYSCLYWASHLADTLAGPRADITPVLDHLRRFACHHLLHWFECLSAMGGLESGLKSLRKATESIAVSAWRGEMF